MTTERNGAEILALFPPNFPLAISDVIFPILPEERGIGLSTSSFPIVLALDATRQNATPVIVDPIPLDADIRFLTVTLFCNGVKTDSKFVTDDELNKQLLMVLAQSDLIEGINEVWLHYRLSSGNTSESPKLKILYSRRLPGGNEEPFELMIEFASPLGNPPLIDPSELLAGIPLKIEYTNKKPYDVVRIDINDKPHHFTVQPGEVGAPLVFTFTMAMYLALGSPATLTFLFTVIDQLNNTTYRRIWSNTITSAVDPIDAELYVMGARVAAVQFWANKSASRYITALDSRTKKPLRARWRYEGETEELATAHFDDIHPGRLLHVRYGARSLTIRPANFFGNGFCDLTNFGSAHSAFVALKDDGKVFTWGVQDNGGRPVSISDVTAVAWSMAAFAVLKADKSVAAWGNRLFGGEVPAPIAARRDILRLCTAGQAIAALTDKNSVLAWGVQANGGQVPASIAALTNIRNIWASATAFTVQLDDRSIRAWGEALRGGVLPAEIAGLRNVLEVINNHDAFAVLLTDRSARAWGNTASGGRLTEPLNNVARIISAGYAFVAHLEDGHIKPWGRPEWGGIAPPSILALDNVIDVVGGGFAFAAILSDYRVVAWGDQAQGGVVPAAIAALRNIVQLAATNGAFAALCADGTVHCWGNRQWGGDTSQVDKRLKDVVAIYSNSEAFLALTTYGAIILWGLSGSGGHDSNAEYQLLEEVSYLASTASQGVASSQSAEMTKG